ncbi:ABC transporter ATP-binding protein [Lactobacillus intestinalis]|uniref:Abc transporter n=1 Tax=Lactobacillus intestinalis DSM 6629 TaxID=1423761 RepID=A0ABR5PMK2_9LACO|nr:ABC transporter ATP-binding protein [Lactobacillus intestinalis]KRM31377.1 abc transporter [Lactobacillus intestinalis DSM 6629]UTW40069.1 ABC transporter ATP-binding protein [Lactobacillus intestinalis]
MKKENQISLFAVDRLLIIAILLSVIGSLFNLILPLFVQQFIDLGSKVKFSISTLLPIILLLIGGSIINAVSSYLISYSGDKRIRNIRAKLEKKLLNLPISFYEKVSSGELVSRVINDSLIIKEFTTNELPSAIISIVTLCGSVLILLILDVRLTFVIIISFTLVSLIAYPLGKVNEKYSFSIQKYLSKLSQVITENIQNIKIIKLYNAQTEVENNFKKQNDKVYSLSKKVDKIFSITGPIQTSFTLLAFLVIILYGSSRVAHHTLSMGILASFMMYVFEIITPINNLANFYVSYSEAKGASQVINKIMEEKEERLQGRNIEHPHVADLKMKHIFFNYTDSPIKVLKDVNVLFEPAKKIAIVGPSGAGKTTLTSILTRLQNTFDGEVLWNKIDAQIFSLKAWRSLFSVVTQDNSVFSGTIKDNLTLGLGYDPSQMQLAEAIKLARLEKFISQLSNGLDFEVGENGKKLSGGQRQKIQIARAYLRNTPFIIFDEATSNLDPESEAEILKAIDKLSEKKTLIVIAHRLSTIVNADKIYFMDNHTILGVGKHSDLLHQIPKYKEFVNDQFISNEE